MYETCYSCDKVILHEVSPAHISPNKRQNSVGKIVCPTAEYTNVDLILEHEGKRVHFATPVCVKCCEILTKPRKPLSPLRIFQYQKIRRVRKLVLQNCIREAFVDRNFLLSNPKVIGVTDLTQELRENRVI